MTNKHTPGYDHVLVTGGAGFIGSHLVDRLLSRHARVTVLDNFNSFYDPAIKRANLEEASRHPGFRLVEGDVRNREDVLNALGSGVDRVIHLAAMAGVRPSLEQPTHYIDVNAVGTQVILDACQKLERKPLFVFASSSSVYGQRQSESFLESDRCDRPISPYAASKMAGEMICHSVHHSSGMDIVCLRFFTVFGPRQRPDLAIHKFCRLIDSGQPIEMYGDGRSQRDYTYVDDIVDGVESVLALKQPGFEVINLGRSEPVLLIDMVRALEKALGKKAEIIHKPMQTGDVPNTFADIDKANQLLSYEPKTSMEEGIARFVHWYRALTDKRVRGELKGNATLTRGSL